MAKNSVTRSKHSEVVNDTSRPSQVHKYNALRTPSECKSRSYFYHLDERYVVMISFSSPFPQPICQPAVTPKRLRHQKAILPPVNTFVSDTAGCERLFLGPRCHGNIAVWFFSSVTCRYWLQPSVNAMDMIVPSFFFLIMLSLIDSELLYNIWWQNTPESLPLRLLGIIVVGDVTGGWSCLICCS